MSFHQSETKGEADSMDKCGNVNTERLSNGKRNLPRISSVLSLDSFFDEKSDLREVFDLDEFQKVQDLSLQDNLISRLPENLGTNLPNLTKIDLSYNNLQELDVCLKALKNLEQLVIDENRLTELPGYLGELHNLRLFSAKGNKLRNISESFRNLVNIEQLDFSDNKIKDISDSWAGLSKLRIVNLSYNELRSMPRCVIQGAPRLETLDLSRNFISEFSYPPLSRNLRRLYLNNNSKNDLFPPWLLTEKFSNLEELILDETVFSSFPGLDEGPTVLHLKKLSMIQCALSDTGFEHISQSMIGLESLNVGNKTTNRDANIFWLMPAKNFKHPDKLEELNIQAVGLPAVPQEINRLGNIRRLNISRNNISSLPEEICELRRLEFLNAACNNLYTLPQGIGNLAGLKILFLETNRLSSLPDSIQNLVHLECLDLYNNEFLQVPEQLDKIPNLKALDIDGNVFQTDNLKIANINYQKARNILRSTSNLLLLRCNNSKVLEETNEGSIDSSSDYADDLRSEENKSPMDTNLSNIASEENWNISEDSADEFDPTEQPRNYQEYSPFTVSPFFYYGNFCPADLHNARIKDQLAAMQRDQRTSANIEEGQFDDA